MKQYTILKEGEFIQSSTAGKYAGWNGGRKDRLIFGRLDCKSGMRMKKENRVFFHTLEEAVSEGYRPCKKCKPIDENDFEEIKHIVPMYNNVQEFYNR
jgi:hypothetical protein